MQVHARLNQLRMSPRKVRLVIGLIRGLPAPAAVRQLEFAPKAAALPVLKLLKSAMANAEHNFHLDASTLRVAKVTADGGPVLKRWSQKAFGRAAPIRKRTAHIHLVLSDEPIADVHRKAGIGHRASGIEKTGEPAKAEKTKKTRAPRAASNARAAKAK
jgi:large subunit ribosomal protein L22